MTEYFCAKYIKDLCNFQNFFFPSMALYDVITGRNTCMGTSLGSTHKPEQEQQPSTCFIGSSVILFLDHKINNVTKEPCLWL